jgi:sugar phosphate permease
LIGAGISCIYLSLIKILSAWFDENEFGAVLGLLMALGMLGNMLATTPLALSVDFMGWRATYVVVAALTVGLAALVHYRVKDAPGEGARSAPPKELAGGPAVQASGGEKVASFFRIMWTLMTNRSYLMLVIFMIAGSSQQGFQSLWAGPFLSRSYGYSLIQVGNGLLWYSVGGICGAPLWGLLSDRLVKSRKRVLIWGSAISVIIWFMPSFFPQALPRNVIPAFLFFMAMAAGGGVLTHAMVRESFSYRIFGIAVGIINFFTFLGGAAFTQLMGHVVASFPKTDGAYPLIAYQATLMLIFGTWVIRLFSLTLTDEQKRTAAQPAAREMADVTS